jgi:hypothetical protein
MTRSGFEPRTAAVGSQLSYPYVKRGLVYLKTMYILLCAILANVFQNTKLLRRIFGSNKHEGTG